MLENRKRLLLRADDLGFSEAVNLGIAKSIKQGLIRSVGLMTNMDASAHGVDLICDTKVCLGQHTNICVGRPLTDPKLIPSLTQPNGEFKTSREYRSSTEDFVNLDEVIIEIEAQYEAFKKLTGTKPQYFEGHAVASANFFKGLEIVAKRHGLDYLEFSMDASPIHFKDKKLHMVMESMKADYNPYETLKNITYKDDVVEMMVCHPGYLDDYILTHSSLTIPRTKEVAMLCSNEARDWITDNGIQIVTYADL